MVPVDILSFEGFSREQLRQLFADNGFESPIVEMPQNLVLVRYAGRTILFDTGMGHHKNQGPFTGKLLQSLKAAGVSREDVTDVCITHGHSDHCWGLTDEQGGLMYPSARVFMHPDDFRHWTDPARGKDPVHKANAEITRNNLLAVKDRVVFFDDQQEILPGVTAHVAAGHSPGNTVFMLSSEGQSLAVIGDLAHFEFIELDNPGIRSLRDPDPARAAASRTRVFEKLAAEHIPFVGFHMPSPGIGEIRDMGGRFKYTAVEV
jgi:glyoxylase-like metal-dependent hydrolase (beta-lactamase superfamily II)